MVDLFFYRKVEDIEEAAETKEADAKEGGQRKKWDTAEEQQGEGGEEEWNA